MQSTGLRSSDSVRPPSMLIDACMSELMSLPVPYRYKHCLLLRGGSQSEAEDTEIKFTLMLGFHCSGHGLQKDGCERSGCKHRRRTDVSKTRDEPMQ